MQAGRIWQHRLWSFHGRDTKLESFFAINQYTYPKDIIEFHELVQLLFSFFKYGKTKTKKI